MSSPPIAGRRRRVAAVASAALLAAAACASLVPAHETGRALVALALAAVLAAWSVAVLRRPTGPPRWTSGVLLVVVLRFGGWWREASGFFLGAGGALSYAATLPLLVAIVALHSPPGAWGRVRRSLGDPVVLALVAWPVLVYVLATFDASVTAGPSVRTWVSLTLALVVVTSAVDLAPSIERGERPRWAAPGRARGAILAAYGAIAALAAVGIRRQWDLNHDPSVTDQGAVLNNARWLLADPTAPIGDRNRMPILTYLTSLRIAPGSSVDVALEPGKQVAAVVAVAGAAVLAWWVARRLSPLAAVTGTGIVVLTVVAFKAPWVQADLLSYLLLLASMVLAWRLLVAPSAMRGAWLGVVLGAAQLTKASALPLVAAVIVGAALGVVLPRRWTGISASARRGLVPAVGCTLLLFCLVLAPNAVNTARVYGDPLYNDNSSAFFWADSWPDAYRSVLPPDNEAGLEPHAPGDEPSFARYRRDHDLGDAIDRLWTGARHQRSIARSSYGYGRFWVLVLGGAVVAMACGDRSLLRRRRLPLVVAVAVVVGYQLLSWWWDPIAQGERFLLVMFLPTVIGSLVLIDRLSAASWVVVGGRRLHLATVLEASVLGLLLWRLPALLELTGQVAGGS